MQEIKDQLKKVIQSLYGLNYNPELTPSPDNINADYSSNVPLKLAKEIHQSPMDIAKAIAEKIARAGDRPGDDPLSTESEKGGKKFGRIRPK